MLDWILFLIYINIISKFNSHDKLFLFANNSLIFLEGNDWEEVCDIALHDLTLLKKWVYFIIVYLQKTFVPVVWDNSYFILPVLIIPCCGGNYLILAFVKECIKNKRNDKYLGIIFDKHLKWIEHIQFLKMKTSFWQLC